jgi:competence protein ComEA
MIIQGKVSNKCLVTWLVVWALTLLCWQPLQAAESVTATAPSSASQNVTSEEKSAVTNEGDKVNINTASAEELARVLSGVGLKKAQALINYRQEFGAFTDLEQLKDVPGFGPALFERNRQLMTL